VEIDAVYLLQPALTLTISVVILLFVWRLRGLRGTVLVMSFLAYWLALGLKGVFQLLSYNSVVNAFGYESVPTSLYFGLQTVFFEVGLAYLFARYGSRKRGFTSKDALAYGASLSFWENGILFGLVSLFQLVVLYLILSTGGSLAAIVTSRLPAAYFLPSDVALRDVALGTLERVSSMLIHVAWGALSVLAATTGSPRFLAIALAMGLVDALVPFSGLVSLGVLEALVFTVSLLCVVIAWLALRSASPAPSPPDVREPS
jgi:hypothetical protein